MQKLLSCSTAAAVPSHNITNDEEFADYADRTVFNEEVDGAFRIGRLLVFAVAMFCVITGVSYGVLYSGGWTPVYQKTESDLVE